MSKLKIFKLIVQPTERCLETLRYIDKNIELVNTLGVGVSIEKISENEIDEDMIEVIRKKGITRLPALLAPDGKLFIGLKQVTDLFEKNLGKAKLGARITPTSDMYGGPATDAEFGSNPDLTGFWERELYAGTDRKGRHVPRKDDEEEDNEKADIENRLSNYRRNIPKHRRADAHRERDIDRTPRQRGGNKYEDPPDDNIASDDDIYDEPAPRARAPRGNNNTGGTEDDMDQRMLAAWMDNNNDTTG